METSDILTTVKGEPISVADVCVRLKTNRIFRNTIVQLIEDKVVARKINQLKIKHNANEIRTYIDQKKIEQGILEPLEMQKYCRWLGISVGQWESYIISAYHKALLKECVIKEKNIENYFSQHKDLYTTISLSRIVKREKQEIDELWSQLKSGGNFLTIARESSIEANSGMLGGYIGGFKKGMINSLVWDKGLEAGEGQLIGVFQEQSFWTLYRVESINYGELTHELKVNIKERLFNDWLKSEVVKVRV